MKFVDDDDDDDELKFKPEPAISSDQALNFAFYTSKQKKQWQIVQILTC